ncbi:hypothetical protein [Marinoscillum pacificum]|uniref:hypothetical protein n=1 Tax=Marinoscillum pacificum TaxID=392723 RepID=UPI0021586912|nr:hypothetical protein [Marinoscillum pacificum]
MTKHYQNPIFNNTITTGFAQVKINTDCSRLANMNDFNARVYVNSYGFKTDIGVRYDYS